MAREGTSVPRRAASTRRAASASSPSIATTWPSRLGKALDQVRQEVGAELRGTPYLWLKRPAKLRPQLTAQLAYLRARHRGLHIARAYAWRRAFEAFFDQPGERAAAYLKRWYQSALRSRLEPTLTRNRNITRRSWEGGVFGLIFRMDMRHDLVTGPYPYEPD